MNLKITKQHSRLIITVASFSAVCIGFSLFRFFYSGTARHLYLPWNLFLGFLPLFFAILFQAFSSRGLAKLSFLAWLIFLPNSFYVVTDLIHLNPIEANLQQYWVGNYRYALEPNSPGILFDAVLLFIYSGFSFVLGLLSIKLVDERLRRRFSLKQRLAGFLAICLACGGAIYVGRVLRYNSWDILVQPHRLAQDLFNILLNPIDNAAAYAISLLFGITIAGFYGLYLALRRV